MGFRNWLQRKIELKKKENDAKAEALASVYEGNAYKNAIQAAEIKKIKEGKTNSAGDWLKRVSKNAAASFGDEKISLDMDKFTGKKIEQKGDKK